MVKRAMLPALGAAVVLLWTPAISTVRPAAAVPQSGTLGFAQIEGFWVAAGGPPSAAPIAAAITGAESGFQPGIIQQGQPYSTTGWGLWQITPGNSVPSQFGQDYQLLDPWNNAEGAVAKYQAAGNTFTPWTTFNQNLYQQFLPSSPPPPAPVTDPGQYISIGSGPPGTNNTSQPGTTFGPTRPGDSPSAIISRWSELGGPGGFLGLQLTAEAAAPVGGGTWVEFQNGAIYNVSPAGLHEVHGMIWLHYHGLAGPLSPLGYPTTDESGTADSIGRYNHFETANSRGQILDEGSIYWTPELGPWSIHGAIHAKWASLGWEAGLLGYPVTDESGTPDGIGRYNHFYKLNGLGQVVDAGAIYWTPELGAWSIHGAIHAKWASLGWETGLLGYPTTDESRVPDGIGRYNYFAKLNAGGQVVDRGAIYWTQQLGAHYIYGGLWTTYSADGGPTGTLGYPTSDPVRSGSVIVQTFQHGRLTWNPATGGVTRT